MYLDSLVVPVTPELKGIKTNLGKITPRANYLNEKELEKIAKADMKKDGGANPDAYEFGKIKVWLHRSFFSLTSCKYLQPAGHNSPSIFLLTKLILLNTADHEGNN